MNELKEKYKNEIAKQLQEKFGITNVMAVPRLTKIVVNSGVGKEYSSNSNVANEMTEVLKQITGQKAIIRTAKEAISNFKLSKGTPNGLMVTLRGERMWDFFEKLVGVTLPRIKDFRGVSKKSFDKRGNYTLGIKDHTIFPEIDTSTLQKLRSLQIVVNTSAGDDEKGMALLQMLGMPFERK